MTATGGARVVAARIDDVVEQAKTQTGLDDFGGDSWREGLEVLVRCGRDGGDVQRVRRAGVLRARSSGHW